MVPMEKVKVLSELSSYDMEQEQAVRHLPLGQKGNPLPLYTAKTPRGKCTLFKTLMANKCKMDCKYCVNSRCSRARQGYSYTPEELAGVFSILHKRGQVQGLFLSSAISDPEDSMEKIIEAAQILRAKRAYKGYMHLKILPGSSFDQVRRAMGLADRVSVNLETVSPSHLSEIASNKDFKNDILKRQAWIRSIQMRLSSPSRNRGRLASGYAHRPPVLPSGVPGGACSHSRPGDSASTGVPRGTPHTREDGFAFRSAPSQTSQVMVGTGGETDREIFSLAASEYDHMGLARMYYSAFRPVEGTPLGGRPPAPLWRQNRLYQADWLYRVYDYSREEMGLAFEDDFLGDIDPKVAIARTTFERPLEINGAGERDLLRVPGIGPKCAKSIALSKEKITSMAHLKRHGAIVGRALPFIKINGLHQTALPSFN